jgi:hypothetical protein
MLARQSFLSVWTLGDGMLKTYGIRLESSCGSAMGEMMLSREGR